MLRAVSDRLGACSTSASVLEASPSYSKHIPTASSFLPSPFWKHHRCCPRPLQIHARPLRQPLLKVKATVGYPASISWWKKGEQLSNVHEITSSDEFYDALHGAAQQDKLVLVEFYSAGCRACKALYPKICQIAAENPNIEVLTVNFYDNVVFCRSLNVNILPFFHFYRGTEGRVDAFSCSLSKIDKLRAAVAKYRGDQPFLTKNVTSPYMEQQKELMVIPTLAAA